MSGWLRRLVGALAGAAAWGVAVGAGVGLAAAFAEDYPRLGLVVLSARLVQQAIVVYVAAAAAGAGIALLAEPALLVLARRLGLDAGARGWVLALFVTGSVWPALALHDRWLLPAGRTPALAALSIGVLLHVALLLAGHRLWPRRALLGAGALVRVVVCVFVFCGGVLGGVGLLARGEDASSRPNLLLVVLDTVRADRLSTYGYPRPTSPEIDAFARNAIRFTEFYSTSSWTLPSHASMFTGLFPAEHGASQTRIELARRHTTLAELLQEQGFQTWGASGNPFVGDATRLTQGFELFVDTWRGDNAAAPGQPHPAVSAFRSFLAGSSRDRPFFAFVNLIEAHAPYAPPADLRHFVRDPVGDVALERIIRKPWTDQFAGDPFTERELRILSDLYDGEIAHASRIFGALLAALREDGRDPNTWVVLTSDHGEHFGENGRVSHVFTLYNTTVRIPLLVRPPGGTPPRVDARPGQLVDLFAALLGALAVETAADHDGRDLLADDFRRETIYSEKQYPVRDLAFFRPAELERSRDRIDPHRRVLRAVQHEGARLIWSSDGRHELFDLRSDPGETRNLYDPASPGPLARALLARIGESEAPAGDVEQASDPDSHLDEETRDALRALGYAE